MLGGNKFTDNTYSQQQQQLQSGQQLQPDTIPGQGSTDPRYQGPNDPSYNARLNDPNYNANPNFKGGINDPNHPNYNAYSPAAHGGGVMGTVKAGVAKVSDKFHEAGDKAKSKLGDMKANHPDNNPSLGQIPPGQSSAYGTNAGQGVTSTTGGPNTYDSTTGPSTYSGSNTAGPNISGANTGAATSYSGPNTTGPNTYSGSNTYDSTSGPNTYSGSNTAGANTSNTAGANTYSGSNTYDTTYDNTGSNTYDRMSSAAMGPNTGGTSGNIGSNTGVASSTMGPGTQGGMVGSGTCDGTNCDNLDHKHGHHHHHKHGHTQGWTGNNNDGVTPSLENTSSLGSSAANVGSTANTGNLKNDMAL